MLNFNVEFQNGTSKISQVRLSVLLTNGTLLSLTEEHIMLGGFTRDTSTTVDGEFTVGAAVTGKLTVIIDNSNNDYDGYDFRQAVITARLGGQLSDETYQLIQVGIYTVDEYTYDGSNITLIAYDNLCKFDKACSNTSVIFPITLSNLVSMACSVAGVTLANSGDLPNYDYSITAQPEQWETMTWHDVIAYCAQIMCCFARILPDGRLYFTWYSVDNMSGVQYDGGTFETTSTPYSDGAIVDGGDFNYEDTINYDGGHFGDREGLAIINQMYDLTVDTDDVLISGIIVELASSDNIEANDDTPDYRKTLGTTDYAITISGNPLIETTANADSICVYLYNHLVGMRFRPLNATLIEDPALEAGDVALVTDRDHNTYSCFLSHVTYTTCASTSVSCDAASTMQNLKARYSEAEKTRTLTQRTFKKAISDSESAMQTIMTALSTTMGLYQYEVSDGHGGTIYIYGNANTLEASVIQWKFTAGVLAVSNDYGATWNAAVSSNGIAILQEVYAVKVNADNIEMGTMTGASITLGGVDNGNGILTIYDENGVLCGTFNNNGVSVNGEIISYQTSNSFASKIKRGKILFFDNKGTYQEVYDATWDEACGIISQGYTSQNPNTVGMAVTSPEFIAFGEHVEENKISANFVVNPGQSYDGITYKVISNSDFRAKTNIILATKGTSSYSIRWLSNDYSNANGYAYIGYYEDNHQYYMYVGDNSIGSYAVGLHVRGGFTCGGTKNRVVETEHYDTVGMNAFETASSHFADVGSGTVGEDGTVTIFFDTVFIETIEENAEYQVLLTRTSAKQTEWVEKHQGYFIVHGESGATFDWMLIGYQKGYVTNRMENINIEEPKNTDPIVTENDSAINAVNAMVENYNSQLEDI